VVLDLVARELGKAGAGYVLDGFPRTVAQAEALERLLESRNGGLDIVVALELEDDVIVKRLRDRWSCPRCGAVYNLSAAPPKLRGVCDSCGAALVQRDDDREETIRDRLRVYRDQTEPLKHYYAEKGLLKGVDGRGGVGEVYERVKSIVAGLT
jgi:adenylate kinase